MIEINTDNIVDVWNIQANVNSSSYAIKYNNKLFTYSEIDRRANCLAQTLESRGVKNETIVGVLLHSSDYYIISILAILKAGGAFLPIDISYPKSRIEYILKDSKITTLITEETYSKNITFNGIMLDVFDDKNYDLIPNSKALIYGNNLAYVMYTSGTTGFPKGVMIEHKGVVSLVAWFNAKYNIEKNKNILQITNISFDVSIEEIFGTLLNGGTLFIPPNSVRIHKSHFRDYVKENKINIVQTVPVMLKELILNNEKLESLNVIICGGEALDEDLKNLVLQKGYNLYNHYGPTEITVDATSCKCRLEEKVSIGTPIDNMFCYVVNNDKTVGIGEVGELYISGVGIARGYLNKPELTEEKFVTAVFSGGERMYKTGDLVMYDEEMKLVYVGRVDDQIKIRGNRVELKEIEFHLLRHPMVKDGVALVIEEPNKEKKVAVFWVGDVSTNEIMEQLLKSLPAYMIPNYLKEVNEFKYTLNGKLDREELKLLVKGNRMETEKDIYNYEDNKIIEVLSEILEKPVNILLDSIYYNLTYLGIDSVKFVKAIITIEEEFDIEFEDQYLDYRKYNNIKELIQYIEKLRRIRS